MQELIKGLHGAADAKVGGTAMINADDLLKTADMLESQAAEIGVLKIAHEAHQTNNLKMLAVLKKQNAEIEKYKALCDQMATVMTNAVEHRWPYLDDMRSLIEAGGAMR